MIASIIMSLSKWYSGNPTDISMKGMNWKAVFRTSMRIVFIIGILFVALSSTPLSLVLEILLYVVPALFMVLLNVNSIPRKVVFALAATSSLVCIISAAVEIPCHMMPSLPKASYDRVYVVGDSMSAGIGFKGEKTWPEIAAEKYHVKITNLSQGGGTARSAISQAKLIKDSKVLVFIEIGGNDMLGRTPLVEYRRDLGNLLEAVKGPERTLVMLEIPWAPFHGAFCSTQRELAAKYGAILVPRRILSSVLSGSESTVDGIHLSNQGHQKMAEAFSGICGGMIK